MTDLTDSDLRKKQILDEMREYLNSAKYTLFSNSHIVVERSRMEAFLRELYTELEIPEETVPKGTIPGWAEKFKL